MQPATFFLSSSLALSAFPRTHYPGLHRKLRLTSRDGEPMHAGLTPRQRPIAAASGTPYTVTAEAQ